MKILMVVDSAGWAIGKLAQSIIDLNPQFTFELFVAPPKEVRAGLGDHVERFRESARKCDIIHIQYWSLAHELHERAPEVFDMKPVILTHHNQKNLLTHDWSWVDAIVCHTEKAHMILSEKYKNVHLIRHGIDFELFKYRDDWKARPRSIGYVGRIVPWKGLKEVAIAAHELGTQVIFMGKMDKPEYWETISEEVRNCIDFSFNNCADEDRPDAYAAMKVYVGNSEDMIEEGTLPYYEAMASGVPVVTTPNGAAADLSKDGHNALVVPFAEGGKSATSEQLKEAIQKIFNDEKLGEELRKNAWMTVKNWPIEKMAREYAWLYNLTVFGEEPLVSVIIPATFDREEQVRKILDSLNTQSYDAIEAIVVWDEEDSFRLQTDGYKISVRQLYTGGEKYGLAKARNLGAIEALGEYLVFCDSRMMPENSIAIQAFVHALESNSGKYWFFGEKGSGKKTFVENWSAISRRSFIDAGMMNERIEQYGGMSQELRSRFSAQGFTFEYLEDARATQIATSHMTQDRRSDIVKSKLLLYKMNCNQ